MFLQFHFFILSNFSWSDTGLAGVPQPDNFSLRDIRGNEGCLAITQNAYGSNEGFKWHDLGCVQLKHFVCEDSDKLIQYAKAVDRSRAHLI